MNNPRSKNNFSRFLLSPLPFKGEETELERLSSETNRKKIPDRGNRYIRAASFLGTVEFLSFVWPNASTAQTKATWQEKWEKALAEMIGISFSDNVVLGLSA